MNYMERLEYKNIVFKNRVIMPPMATAKADKDGYVTDDILSYYNEKTSDKFLSAVIIEHSFVDILGKAHDSQTSIADDCFIDGMKKLADVIHSNDSLAILQIAHAGSLARESIIGSKPVAPSSIINPARANSEIPRELSIAEIKDIIEKFVNAAERAMKAGFDGVEIHSAHGYLLNQFLSPLTNKRADEFGGDISNRIRIHLEIIRGIRKRLGEKYPIFIRVGAGDFVDDGLSEDDVVFAAKEFEKAGVDVIDISGGMCSFDIKDDRAGYFDVLSKPIYDSVNIPVILTGGVKKCIDIQDILNREVCDLVGVGRTIFKDSDWIKKEIKRGF